jgi:hypothetical protein
MSSGSAPAAVSSNSEDDAYQDSSRSESCKRHGIRSVIGQHQDDGGSQEQHDANAEVPPPPEVIREPDDSPTARVVIQSAEPVAQRHGARVTPATNASIHPPDVVERIATSGSRWATTKDGPGSERQGGFFKTSCPLPGLAAAHGARVAILVLHLFGVGIHPSARRHGIGDDDIRHAHEQALAWV